MDIPNQGWGVYRWAGGGIILIDFKSLRAFYFTNVTASFQSEHGIQEVAGNVPISLTFEMPDSVTLESLWASNPLPYPAIQTPSKTPLVIGAIIAILVIMSVVRH